MALRVIHTVFQMRGINLLQESTGSRCFLSHRSGNLSTITWISPRLFLFPRMYASGNFRKGSRTEKVAWIDEESDEDLERSARTQEPSPPKSSHATFDVTGNFRTTTREERVKGVTEDLLETPETSRTARRNDDGSSHSSRSATRSYNRNTQHEKHEYARMSSEPAQDSTSGISGNLQDTRREGKWNWQTIEDPKIPQHRRAADSYVAQRMTGNHDNRKDRAATVNDRIVSGATSQDSLNDSRSGIAEPDKDRQSRIAKDMLESSKFDRHLDTSQRNARSDGRENTENHQVAWKAGDLLESSEKSTAPDSDFENPSDSMPGNSDVPGVDVRKIISGKLPQTVKRLKVVADIERQINKEISMPRRDEKVGDLVFGINPVLLALRQGKRKGVRLHITEAKSLSQEAPVKEILEICRARGIWACKAQSMKLNNLSANRPHQGIVLECSALLPEVIEISALKDSLVAEEGKQLRLWLFLDCIMDPMNLGAILRSAYFFGVDRVILVDGNGCPLTSTVSKASAGIMEVLPIFAVKPKEIPAFFNTMKEASWDVVGAASRNEDQHVRSAEKHSLRTLKAKGNIVLVLGSESRGINTDILELCSKVVTIEPGKADLLDGANCLNVSVAAGVVLSQMVIQQQQDL